GGRLGAIGLGLLGVFLGLLGVFLGLLLVGLGLLLGVFLGLGFLGLLGLFLGLGFLVGFLLGLGFGLGVLLVFLHGGSGRSGSGLGFRGFRGLGFGLGGRSALELGAVHREAAFGQLRGVLVADALHAGDEVVPILEGALLALIDD